MSQSLVKIVIVCYVKERGLDVWFLSTYQQIFLNGAQKMLKTYRYKVRQIHMGLYYGIFLFCNQHLAPNKHEWHA
jgi:hypothetical protein